MNVNELIFGHTIIAPKLITTYLPRASHTKQWLAEIKGIDTSFGFSREFYKPTRNIFRPDIFICYYELKAGKIYEYSNFYLEFGEFTSGFFAVTENQKEIIDLERTQVRRLLGMAVKDWEIKEVKITDKGNYANDDIPF